MESLKTREWLMVIFIIMLIQFVVQACAWLYGGNSGALGYISFAGTIISIILAVLAIVYSYIQSISQQSSANTISSQVDKLIDVTSKISSSKSDLGTSLEKLGDVSAKIDNFFTGQIEIGQSVHDLHAKIDQAISRSPEKYSAESPDKINNDGSQNICEKIMHSYNGATLSGLVFYYGEKEGYSVDGIIEKFEKIIDEFRKGDKSILFLKDFFRGALLATSQMLDIYDLITESKEKDTYSLNEDFRKVCARYVDQLEKKQLPKIFHGDSKDVDLLEIYFPYLKEISNL